MSIPHGRTRIAGAFTLLELLAAIAVLLLITAVALPKYLNYSTKANESSIRSTLGETRAAIASYCADAVGPGGSVRYPSLEQLQQAGPVLGEALPANPYNGSSVVQAATWDGESPPVSGTAGWNYDPAGGRFWANSDTGGVDENEW